MSSGTLLVSLVVIAGVCLIYGAHSSLHVNLHIFVYLRLQQVDLKQCNKPILKAFKLQLLHQNSTSKNLVGDLFYCRCVGRFYLEDRTEVTHDQK